MKKKGFTLIELISVIVVLGVLAIIAVPTVTNQISDTKKETYKASVRSVFDSVSTYLAKNKDLDDIPSTGIVVPEGEIYKQLDLKKQIFIDGLIYRDEDGVMKVQNLTDGTYCASGSKNDLKVVSGACEQLDITEPEINIYESRITSDSITIVVNSSDNESGITSFKYYLDGKFIEETKNNVYTYKNLKANTKYHIEVKSINGNNQEATAAVDISTKSGKIIFKVNPEDWSRSKNLTLTYPENKGKMIYQYQIVDKTDWVTIEEIATDILIEENTTVNARVIQNGIEIIQTTKSFNSIDKEAPDINSIDCDFDGWAISKPVTIKATDLKSGLAPEAYSFDGGNTWQESPTKVLTENTVLNIVVKDAVGNISPVEDVIVGKIDSTIPQSHQITATAGEKNYASGSWTNNDVELKANPKPVAPSGYKYQWYKKSGSSYVAIDRATNQTYTVSIDDLNTYKVDVQTNAGSAVVPSNTYDVKVDKIAPIVELTGMDLTTNSAKVTFTAKDEGAGIENETKTCVYGTSTNYGLTGTISGNTCILSNLKSETTYYYQICVTDKVGNTKCRSGSTKPTSITNPSITYTNTPEEIQNGYVKQQIAHVKYESAGITNPRYFVKTTKTGTSNVAVTKSCGTGINPLASCTPITSRTNLEANMWYEVTGNVNVTYDEASTSNETVFATTYDGVNFSKNISGTLAKIDLTSASVTLGTATPTSNSISISYTLSDAESGIGSYTCKYVDAASSTSISNASFTTNGSSVTSTKCVINSLKEYTSYYYQICATDKVGNTTSCQTGTVKTTDATAPSTPTITLRLNSSSGSTYTSGSWTNQNVYHIVNSSDSGSGIAYYQYSHNGSTNWSNDIDSLGWSSSYNNSSKTQLGYLINWAGNWNFYIRAVDNAGNVSKNSSMFTVRIDKTAPSLSGLNNASGGNWAYSPFNVSYNVAESASGIARCQYKYASDILGNCNDWCNENNTVSNGVFKTSFSYQRDTTAYFRCIDNAGNVSNTLSTSIRIDNCQGTTTSYGSWGSCSKTCGGGTQTRTVTKKGISGKTCSSTTESRSCNTQACNCGWGMNASKSGSTITMTFTPRNNGCAFSSINYTTCPKTVNHCKYTKYTPSANTYETLVAPMFTCSTTVNNGYPTPNACNTDPIPTITKITSSSSKYVFKISNIPSNSSFVMRIRFNATFNNGKTTAMNYYSNGCKIWDATTTGTLGDSNYIWELC